jgi:hypothetical protein
MLLEELSKDTNTPIERNNMGVPARKLTRAEKISRYGSEEKWAAIFMIAIDHYFGTSFSNSNVIENLDLIEKGIFNSTPYKSWINPYVTQTKEAPKFPIDLKHYDILSPKLNVLFGEEIMRPFNFTVVNKASSAANKYQEEIKNLVEEFVKQDFLVTAQKMMAEEGVPPTEIEGIINPEKPVTLAKDGTQLEGIKDIKEYVEKHYSDLLEIAATDLLNYLQDYLKIRLAFNRNFLRFLSCGREIFYVGESNGEPDFRIVDPRFFSCSLSHDEIFIEKSDALREERFLTLGDIMDEFHDYLTEEDIKFLDNVLDLRTSNKHVSSHFDTSSFYYQTEGAITIRVAHYEWVALRKYGIVSQTLPDGEVEEELVDETYKVDKSLGQTVKWVWLPERWEGVRIGDQVFCKMRRIPHQFRSIDNPGTTRSNYCGIFTEYSLVDKAKSYQFFYNVIMQQLAMAFSRAKGKVFLYDISQIPTSQGWDIDKWMYFIDVLGQAPINSKERDINGDVSKFNQWQQIDLTLGNTIQSYISQLEYLDQKAMQMMGLTAQRLGNISSSETVGGVERSVTQSSASTEIYFYLHSEAKKSALDSLLNIAKVAFKRNGKIQYVASDGARKVIEFSEDFLNSDFGIFVSNSGKDQRNLKFLQELSIQYASSQQMEMSAFIKMIQTNSLAEATIIMKEMEARLAKTAEEKQRIEQEQMQIQMQQAQANIEFQKQLKMQEFELEKLKIEVESATKIKVAEITSAGHITSRRQDVDVDANNNGILDVMEMEKLELKKEQLKLEKDNNEHNQEMDKKELKLKEKQINQNAKS